MTTGSTALGVLRSTGPTFEYLTYVVTVLGAAATGLFTVFFLFDKGVDQAAYLSAILAYAFYVTVALGFSLRNGSTVEKAKNTLETSVRGLEARLKDLELDRDAVARTYREDLERVSEDAEAELEKARVEVQRQYDRIAFEASERAKEVANVTALLGEAGAENKTLKAALGESEKQLADERQRLSTLELRLTEASREIEGLRHSETQRDIEIAKLRADISSERNRSERATGTAILACSLGRKGRLFASPTYSVAVTNVAKDSAVAKNVALSVRIVAVDGTLQNRQITWNAISPQKSEVLDLGTLDRSVSVMATATWQDIYDGSHSTEITFGL